MSSDKDITGIEGADTSGGAQGFVCMFKTSPQVGFKMANESEPRNNGPTVDYYSFGEGRSRQHACCPVS